jgi:excisionase family DNA binding protein
MEEKSVARTSSEGEILTLAQAAEYLNASLSTVLRLVNSGELRAFRIRTSNRREAAPMGARQGSSAEHDEKPWPSPATLTPSANPRIEDGICTGTLQAATSCHQCQNNCNITVEM